ncbi:extracellular solute-binding protein [Paenibacillus thalictri]|uniref:Extracellular solute-binding protein n=1 Tax=Paenibacillus thalictri TaxID=2527873 RepID=A0A4Q9DXP3_9BACL|nr:extracellular solute-binding protein [Paenibacillus thalictri]TBL81155.1 extracellular solute-binding protein [Paenibacillus thalictri]
MGNFNTKKTAAIGITCIAALAVVLAACSKEQAGGSPDTGNAAETKAKRGQISASFYDRGTVPQQVGNVEKNNWTQYVNEKGPVDVKFVPIPRGESVQKLNVLFASGSAPDVIHEFDAPFRNQLYASKQIMPIDDLIEKNSTVYKKLLQKYPELKKASTKPDGKMYEFGRVQRLVGFQALFIRNDWLKKLNLKVPQTTEELLQVAKAFTELDPDGNGKKDTYGIALSSETGSAVDAMFQNFGWISDNGKMVKDWDRAEAALAFKKQIYDSGLTDKDFLADKNGQKSIQDWVSGKTGIFVGRTIDTVNFKTYYEPLKKNVPDAEVIAIKLPASKFGRFAAGVNNPVQMTTVINSAAKDPAAAMKYVDFMASDEAAKAFRYGFENVHYTLGKNGCPVQKDPEKYKTEIAWNVDFQLLLQQIEMGDCAQVEAQLNPDVPAEKEFIELIKQNNEANLASDVQYGRITHSEHFPSLPSDLQTVATNTAQISDIYNKAIVAGANYSVEQAMKDAKKMWADQGGKQLEDFYGKWYAEQKDKAFLAADMMNFAKK